MVLVPRPRLSAVAERLELYTLEDCWREFRAAEDDWSTGNDYGCLCCDRRFWSVSGARKHMKAQGHPVLRVDLYGDLLAPPMPPAVRAPAMDRLGGRL